MTIKEQHVSEFSGFPFCLKYSRLVARGCNPETSNCTEIPTQISPNRILHFQAKGPGKRLEGQKHLDNKCSTLAKQHRKTVAPPACKQ